MLRLRGLIFPRRPLLARIMVPVVLSLVARSLRRQPMPDDYIPVQVDVGDYGAGADVGAERIVAHTLARELHRNPYKLRFIVSYNFTDDSPGSHRVIETYDRTTHTLRMSSHNDSSLPCQDADIYQADACGAAMDEVL